MLPKGKKKDKINNRNNLLQKISFHIFIFLSHLNISVQDVPFFSFSDTKIALYYAFNSHSVVLIYSFFYCMCDIWNNLSVLAPNFLRIKNSI